jgi:hypothetical protein
MFVYVFTTRCAPVVNFKTLKLFRIGIFPILRNVVVTASVVVYLQYKYIYTIFNFIVLFVCIVLYCTVMFVIFI